MCHRLDVLEKEQRSELPSVLRESLLMGGYDWKKESTCLSKLREEEYREKGPTQTGQLQLLQAEKGGAAMGTFDHSTT